MANDMNNILSLKQSLTTEQLSIVQGEMNKRQKSKAISYVLWFFTGVLAGHRWYSGHHGYAFCMVLFGWLTLFIWPLIDVFFVGQSIEEANNNLEKQIIQEVKSFYTS